MKKIIALVLCIAICASLICLPASAASGTLSREEELAEGLKALGLFKGVSETDFALNRAPTRVEALVMLIRVLGKESDALAKGGRHPFSDVPEWADKYVGYAYENNLTNGVSETKFGASSEASAAMYITFVLRALGYSDKNGDFTWDNPFALAKENGIMKGNPNVQNFLRADVVLVSYAALEAEVKGTGKTLAEKLIEANAFTATQYDEVRRALDTPVAGMSEAEVATILGAWIENNTNATFYLVYPGYQLVTNAAEFDMSQAIVYDENSKAFACIYNVEYKNGEGFYSSIKFSPESDVVAASYSYYKLDSFEPDVSGEAILHKGEIFEDMTVTFDEESGIDLYNREIHKQNAAMMWYGAAQFLHRIMKINLSDSGIDGAHDLGFTRVYE